MSIHPNVSEIVKLITSEIKTLQDKKEMWATFKRKNASLFKSLLQLEHTTLANPGELIGFDIDESRCLMLLNYTGSAHNILHEIEGGWSEPLRHMRGLVYDFSKEEPTLVSRGFEKFFNYNELPENSYNELSEKYGDQKFCAREKADGHMIEYYIHDDELCSSTRGKFGTASAAIASNMLSLSDFHQVEKTLGVRLMSLVVELVHPDTKVFVDYDNAEMLYLLNAYDSDGEQLSLGDLEYICESMPHLFTCPESREMTLREVVGEVNSRSVSNHEGWVVNFNGELIKFKYINYIGEMVKSKLSYKYIMNCIISDRLDKMLFTLPEELRKCAYDMVRDINNIADCSSDYKPLYSLYSDLEGGENYFRTVCRNFWRTVCQQSKKLSMT